MGLSRIQRMVILLSIDVVLCLTLSIASYAVNSLAIRADAYHVFSEVLCLTVGIWASKVTQSGSSKSYTYGWQRAEILGFCISSVFMIAMCMPLFLEAIHRFDEPQQVKDPALGFAIGSFGLMSKLIALLLFHSIVDKESNGRGDRDRMANETRPLLPDNQRDTQNTLSTTHARTLSTDTNPSTSWPSQGRVRRLYPIDNLPVHPASFRHAIIAAASQGGADYDVEEDAQSSPISDDPPVSAEFDHVTHHHTAPRSGESSKNSKKETRRCSLHVYGDIVISLGVMATITVIWLADLVDWLSNWGFQLYFDPFMCLIIMMVILNDSIPSLQAAARILLQAVPADLSIDEVKEDIEGLRGVLNVHHFHVWQLTSTKVVASINVVIDSQWTDSVAYMRLTRAIRQCLHEYGIHSSTIQPEFILGSDDEYAHDVL